MPRANRIKELREKLGLTLQEVADAAGTTLQQIHRLENGTRRLTDEWMRRLAPVLGVHPAALLIEFAKGKHSLNEDIDEALMLELWRMLEDVERLEVMDTIKTIRVRRTAPKVKQKA